MYRKVFITILIVLFFYSSASAQIITSVAGNGLRGYSGDGGPALLAELFMPWQIAIDSTGNLFIADGEVRIRKISPDGIITTYAGDGGGTPSGDGGPATAAGLGEPYGITLDRAGDLYIYCSGSYCIRKVNTAGIITTYAGTAGTPGYSGDGSPATAALLSNPGFLTTDTSGNLYFTDGQRVRKINSSGIITTIANTIGAEGYSGDGGTATAATLRTPGGVAADGLGNLYIADDSNFVIRKIDASGIITTYAGNGSYTYSGDGGPATAAGLGWANGFSCDLSGNVYMGCSYVVSGGSCIKLRKIDTTGIINTIAGTGTVGFSGDRGAATAAAIGGCGGIARYKNGDIYFSDRGNNRIRRISAIPYFTNPGPEAATLCDEAYNIDTLLAANDSNSGNTMSWSLLSGPYHGSAAIDYTTVSTGYPVIPSGLSYTPVAGFTGTDTLKARITDSLVSDTITLYLTVGPLPAPGSISGSDTVCMADSVMLTDTAMGGIWSVSNTSAVISNSGSLKGIAAGTDTVMYTVSNSYCNVSTDYVVTVKNCNEAVAVVSNKEQVNIYPDPSDGSFTITYQSGTNEQAQVTVSSITGAVIKTFTMHANKPEEIALDIPAGVYLVHVNTAKDSYSRKIVIDK